MSRLSILLLGAPEIKHKDHVIEFDTRKATAILAYLAISKKRKSRDELASIFWPTSDQNRSLANLRRTLSTLKAHLDEWLDIERYSVGFRPELDLWIDVMNFRSEITRFRQSTQISTMPKAVKNLMNAATLYRGEFMAGFTLRDSYAFDEWQFFERSELQRDIHFVLEKLVHIFQSQGDYDSALNYARQWLAIDRTQETVHYSVMQLYVATGQPSAALRQYEECQSILHDEFDEYPHPTTSALYNEVKRTKQFPKLPQTFPAEIDISFPENFPSPIGRDRELEKITECLQSPDCRLLNIVGIGGSGKTRLASHIANQFARKFGHGSSLIELGTANSTNQILNIIASKIGLTFYSSSNLEQQLCDFLGEKEMLLVIDNVDQLDDKGLLIEILDAAPAVKILLTAHHRLGFSQEHLFELEGLDYPSRLSGATDLDYPAMKMLEQSFLRHDPFFEPTDNLPSMVEICRLTGGLPLALELAANWISVLSCESIAGEIKRSLSFLEADIKDFPERHKTIEVVLEMSWSKLSDKEQQSLVSLSLFRNGFERTAVERIAGISLQTLLKLRDRVFLIKIGPERYRIPELLRRYIEEHYQKNWPDKHTISSQHADYYSRLLHHWESQLTTQMQSTALKIVMDELENIQLAWSWCLSTRNWAGLTDMLEGLYRFYDTTNLHYEGMNLFKTALEAVRQEQDAADHAKLLIKLYIRYGWFCCWCDQLPAAQTSIEKALQLASKISEIEETALALNHLGVLRLFAGRFDETVAYLQDSVDIYEELHDEWGVARALSNQSVAYRRLGRNGEAKDNLTRSLALYQKAGDQLGVGQVYNNLGNVYYGENSFADAQQFYEQSIAIKKEIYQDFNWGIACTQINLGQIAQLRTDYQQADHILNECLQTFRQIGHQGRIIECLRYLGNVAQKLNNTLSACEYYQESLDRVQKINQAPKTLAVLSDVADYLATMSRFETATNILNRIITRSDADNETLNKAKSTLEKFGSNIRDQDFIADDDSFDKLINNLEFKAKEILSSLV